MQPRLNAGRLYLLGFLLNAPLFSIYGMLPFIMCKELNATGLQITLLIAMKPVMAIFSTYWSSFVANRADRLKYNIAGAIFLGALPTLFFPLYSHNWLYMLGFAAYFFAERAVIPAWIEVLKLNLPPQTMSKAVGSGSLVVFISGALFQVFVTPWMDHNIAIWKWLFVTAAILSCLRLLLVTALATPTLSYQENKQTRSSILLHPWRNSINLLKRRPDFAMYQLIFFFGGLGIMITQPALPKFVEGILHFSYTEVAIAIVLCKGIGFVISNPFWARWIHRVDLYRFCSAVTIAAALSLTLVVLSAYQTLAIYAGFLVYGIMQSGSHLSWQLAGPIFAGDAEDSSSYTSVNVLLVGIRGCIGPFLGGALCSLLGLKVPYLIGTLFCLTGAACGLIGSRLQTRLAPHPTSE